MGSKEHAFIEKLSYTLPDDRIAKYPLHERDASKLLVYQNGTISEDRFRNIPGHLPAGSLLFFNNTRVIHARLKFKRATGASIEIFCLTPVAPHDYQTSFASRSSCSWLCMVGNLKKWKEEELEIALVLNGQSIILKARQLQRSDEGITVSFSWNAQSSFAEIIEAAGTLPIPPYLNRDTENLDRERYQTVYSRHDGSVAAPTAGLHFTDKTLEEVRNKNIDTLEVTLHVGAGTFKPVKSTNALEHEMHHEFFTVSREVISRLARHQGLVIATGTTSLRSLESLYWLALLSVRAEKPVTHLSQWAYRSIHELPSYRDVFGDFEKLMNRYGLLNFSASTGIMIVPGYRFQVVNGLITNFHQPESTLLLLVAAFIGDDWKALYRYALQNDFRFLSYGDSSLLWRNTTLP